MIWIFLMLSGLALGLFNLGALSVTVSVLKLALLGAIFLIALLTMGYVVMGVRKFLWSKRQEVQKAAGPTS